MDRSNSPRAICRFAAAEHISIEDTLSVTNQVVDEIAYRLHKIVAEGRASLAGVYGCSEEALKSGGVPPGIPACPATIFTVCIPLAGEDVGDWEVQKGEITRLALHELAGEDLSLASYECLESYASYCFCE